MTDLAWKRGWITESPSDVDRLRQAEFVRGLGIIRAAIMPNARSIEMADAGHMIPVERPREYAQSVAKFAAECMENLA